MNNKIVLGKVRIFYSILLVLVLGWSTPGLAMDLGQAKAQGLVGEMQNGYLGAVSGSPSAQVSSLVSGINQKRKSLYQDIAKRNGTSVTAVETLAGKKAIEKTPAGQYVQPAPGQWVKK